MKSSNGLLKFLQEQRGSRHPIEGHPLAGAEHLTKNLYFNHLCAAALYQTTLNDAQLVFLDRLTAGVQTEYCKEDYMRMSMDLTGGTVAEFFDGLKNTPLKYAFAIDALLLCHMQECGEEQAEFLAEVFDALTFTEPELKYLLDFAKAILTMDKEAVTEAERLRPKHINKATFVHYARLIGEDVAAGMKKTTLEELKYIAQEKKRCEHVVSGLTLNAETDKQFDNFFVRGEKIAFQNCGFSCGKPLKFEAYDEVVFKDCTFCDFASETVVLNDVKKVLFLNCNFTNCIKRYSEPLLDSKNNEWSELSGVIKCRMGRRTEVDIDACVFKNCGGVNTRDCKKSSIISNGRIRCVNSSFERCRNIYTGPYGTTEDTNKKAVLFSHVLDEANNVLNDSSRLKPE